MTVAGDEHQGGAGVQRLDHTGEQVGGAGAQGRVAHAHTAGYLGVGVGGEHAAALVVHQIVVDAEPARGIVERQELKPAHAEHRSDLVRDQHARQRFAAGHLHRFPHSPFLLVCEVQCRPPGPQIRVRSPPAGMPRHGAR